MKKGILFVGQSFYHAWYLSRELRRLGWKADVLNFDTNPKSQMFYHGEDFKFEYDTPEKIREQVLFYFDAILTYDIFHFSNAYGMYFLQFLDNRSTESPTFWDKLIWSILKIFLNICNWNLKIIQKIFLIYIFSLTIPYVRAISQSIHLPRRLDIFLLKKLGKKITYSTNGCLDGASQTSFGSWGPHNTCELCNYKNKSSVCSDSKNLEWGKFRNEMADYIFTFDFSPTDYNLDSKVHFHPEFYCMDSSQRDPEILVPANYLLPFGKEKIKIYHTVGNFETRRSAGNQTIRCTHIYLPLIEKLKKEKYPIELVFFYNVPNKEIIYYQAQVDIIVDVLTYGWFGATIREGLMMGKVCVCYIRPKWAEYIAQTFPEYADYIRELPVVSATPDTIEEVLKDLLYNPEKRQEIGRKSREFAIKWHSSKVAAEKLDRVFSHLIGI